MLICNRLLNNSVSFDNNIFSRKTTPYIYALDYTQNDKKVQSKNEKKRKKVLGGGAFFVLLSRNKTLSLFDFFLSAEKRCFEVLPCYRTAYASIKNLLFLCGKALDKPSNPIIF